jgi:carbohydrate binding protein with CBM5/12 domain
VTYGGTAYTGRQAHTAIAGWEPPNTPALWQAG